MPMLSPHAVSTPGALSPAPAALPDVPARAGAPADRLTGFGLPWLARHLLFPANSPSAHRAQGSSHEVWDGTSWPSAATAGLALHMALPKCLQPDCCVCPSHSPRLT